MYENNMAIFQRSYTNDDEITNRKETTDNNGWKGRRRVVEMLPGITIQEQKEFVWKHAKLPTKLYTIPYSIFLSTNEI